MAAVGKVDLEMEIYDDRKEYQRQIRRVEKSGITRENKDRIIEFALDCLDSELSYSRVGKYVQQLRQLALWLGKDFREASRQDIKRLVGKLTLRGYKPRTRRDYKHALKKFYTWLEGDGNEPPGKVRWVKVSIKKNEITLPGVRHQLCQYHFLRNAGEKLMGDEYGDLARAVKSKKVKARVRKAVKESGVKKGRG